MQLSVPGIGSELFKIKQQQSFFGFFFPPKSRKLPTQKLAHLVWWGEKNPVMDDGIFAYFLCKNNKSQTVHRCIHASPEKQAW